MRRNKAPDREQHVANRELGTVEKTDANGNLQMRLDSGRRLTFNIRQNPHLDYGYAVTSHSSQGQTADRVLVHVDTEQAGEKLVNRRLAYVAISRGRYDAQIYTNDAMRLGEALSRDISKPTALSVGTHESLVNQQFVAKQLAVSNGTARQQVAQSAVRTNSIGYGRGARAE